MDKERWKLGYDRAIELIVTKGPEVLLAIFFLIVGWWFINQATRVARRHMIKRSVDPSLISFISSLVSIIFKVLLIISVAGMIGIETTSFVAAIGAAGLAIGLALQGSLSNFAGGVLILFFKPFKVGDDIEGEGGAGVVERIDILHTTLSTANNEKIIIPNGQLSNNEITNFTRSDERRVVFTIGIGYNDSIQTARNVMLKALNQDKRTLEIPEPLVHVTKLGDSSVELQVKAWVKTADYVGYKFDNLEQLKLALDNAGVSIPYPQRDIHHYQHVVSGPLGPQAPQQQNNDN